MPSLRLTKRAVEALPHPATGQVFYRDTELSGLGLRVGRRAKSYFVEAQVGRRTRRVTIGRADLVSADIARRRALGVLSEMAEGHDPNARKSQSIDGAATVSAAFEAFFAARPQLAPKTVLSYRRTANLYLADWSTRQLGEITRQMVLSRHQRISKERGKVTANNAMRHLRSVYNFVAATQDEFPPNPATILTQARAWHRERRRRTVITPAQLPAWWQAVEDQPDDARDFLLTALFTGLRRSELVSLHWKDVDLVGRALHLPTTKNGDPLDLPLSRFLGGLLERRRDDNSNSDWVFPGRDRRTHLVEPKKYYARVSAASGVDFTLHDLRRTFITIAESLDIPHYALKRLLNHRTDSDVTGGYIIISAERLREPVEKVAARILELARHDLYRLERTRRS